MEVEEPPAEEAPASEAPAVFDEAAVAQEEMAEAPAEEGEEAPAAAAPVIEEEEAFAEEEVPAQHPGMAGIPGEGQLLCVASCACAAVACQVTGRSARAPQLVLSSCCNARPTFRRMCAVPLHASLRVLSWVLRTEH